MALKIKDPETDGLARELAELTGEPITIAVDTSALVATVLGEPAGEALLEAIQRSSAIVGAPTLVEAVVVVEARQGPDPTRDLGLLVDGAVDQVVAFDEAHARSAADAWRRFGKGRHPAGPNFGDCLAYPTAHVAGVPLLYLGKDFPQTDVATARY